MEVSVEKKLFFLNIFWRLGDLEIQRWPHTQGVIRARLMNRRPKKTMLKIHRFVPRPKGFLAIEKSCIPLVKSVLKTNK